MKINRCIIALGVIAACAASPAYASYSIANDQLDAEKIYYGNGQSFEKPAAVKIEEVIKATPEYEQIRKDKIERGTGKYWILISQATERAVQNVSVIAKETEYDLVAAEGYLDHLSPAIPNVDITEMVLKHMAEDK